MIARLFDLNQGTLELRLRSIDDDDNWRVQTPVAALTFVRRGVVPRLGGRARSIRSRSSCAMVRSASNRRAAPSMCYAGQAVYVRGGDRPSYDVRELPREDDFDRWAYDRDRDEDNSEAARYVGRDMTGYESLDGHGRWVESDDYGRVWMPYGVARDWAPYRYGRWMWVDPWGWTWIDDQPWGFAPFHYGRWARYRGGVGLGAGRARGASGLRAGARGLRRRRQLERDGALRRGRRCRLVPARAGRSVRARVPCERSLRAQRQLHDRAARQHPCRAARTCGGMKYRNMREEGAVTAVPRETFATARPARGYPVERASRARSSIRMS